MRVTNKCNRVVQGCACGLVAPARARKLLPPPPPTTLLPTRSAATHPPTHPLTLPPIPPQVRAVEEAPPDEHEDESLKAFHKLEQHLST